LEAGTSVYTTLNVQHLESLKDIVAQITGISVAETVPDSVFEEADEVELVDLPADDLLDRMREGKVYVPNQADRAVKNFFSKGNLIALRELALRKAAERVGAQMEDYREEHGVSGVWPVNERLLVCVGPSPFSTRLVRATRRIAGSLRAPWMAVHVETPADSRLPEGAREQLSETLHLAEQLGGEIVTISGHNLTDELINYAHSRNVTKIVVGKPNRSRWREWLQGSLVYELTRKCGDIDVYVITGDREEKSKATSRAETPSVAGNAYLASFFIVLACTLINWPLSQILATAPTNLIMVYLLGIVVIATRFGGGPSVLASVLSVATFDFFFVPPVFTFAVQDTQYVFTFVVMLATALTISTLTTRVTFQAESARSRERRTASLYSISHQLAAARMLEQIAQAAVRHVADAIDAKVTVLVSDVEGHLISMGPEINGFEPSANDQAVARWVMDHEEAAGHGTTTLPGSAGLYLPLRASHGAVGVLGILPNTIWKTIGPERFHLLETFAGLIALAIERVQLAAEAARIRVQMETEKLRSSLLSAVSHDLRTPLSVITGGASTLLDSDGALEPKVRRELLESVLEEADHLNRLVANLLDMTRLEAGAIEVHKEWQSVEEIVGVALGRMARQLKDHPMITHLPDELPFVPMDDLLIEQVLVNLVDNAAKYSPAGSPIELSGRAENNRLIVEISDRGPGMPQAELDRVFEKFYRAANSDRRPGAGLGLAICRGIIELHGGRIVAENRPGGGAVFRFDLPLATGQPEIPDPETSIEA
jgi:two-component system sensor histidine kinase KdpD